MGKNHGRPFRLAGYDYGSNGCYFITFCTRNRENLLSSVGRGLAPGSPPVLTLSSVGTIMDEQIYALPQRFPSVTIEKYVIMPNHVHLLLSITELPGASPRPTIPQIISTCKSLTTRLANLAENRPGRIIFQTSFHDEIIRDDEQFLSAWQYMDANPALWREDEYYTDDTEDIP